MIWFCFAYWLFVRETQGWQKKGLVYSCLAPLPVSITLAMPLFPNSSSCIHCASLECQHQ